MLFRSTILGDAGDSSGTPSRAAVDLERPDSTAAVPLGKKKIVVDSNAEYAKDSVGHEQRKVEILYFCSILVLELRDFIPSFFVS